MIKICYEIENCTQCHNYDHSGAFTPEGAIPLCGGVGGKGVAVPGEPRWPNQYNSVLPNRKRKYTGEVPDWCPLRSEEATS